jgi:uncharacterized protein (UPF0333 family)
MKDLTKHFANNFNLWSLNENKSNKYINGKEKSKLTEDVEIFVLSNGEEEETINSESPIMTKVAI